MRATFFAGGLVLLLLLSCSKQPTTPVGPHEVGPRSSVEQFEQPLSNAADRPILTSSKNLRGKQQENVQKSAEQGAMQRETQVGGVVLLSSNIIKPFCDFDPGLTFRATSMSTLPNGEPYPLDQMSLELNAEWRRGDETKWRPLFYAYLSAMDEWYLQIERSYTYGAAWYGRSVSSHHYLDAPDPPTHYGIDHIDELHYGETLANCANLAQK